jgi:hypothetical protein
MRDFEVPIVFPSNVSNETEQWGIKRQICKVKSIMYGTGLRAELVTVYLREYLVSN